MSSFSPNQAANLVSRVSAQYPGVLSRRSAQSSGAPTFGTLPPVPGAIVLAAATMRHKFTSGGSPRTSNSCPRDAASGSRVCTKYHVTVRVGKPQVYIEPSDRAAVNKAFADYKRRLGRVRKDDPRLRSSEVIKAGLKGTSKDVNDSERYDRYMMICKTLGVPEGTYISQALLNDSIANTGLTPQQRTAAARAAGVFGDMTEGYLSSDEFRLGPKSRLFGSTYEDRLRGGVLIALGILPQYTSAKLTDELKAQDRLPYAKIDTAQREQESVAARRRAIELQKARREAKASSSAPTPSAPTPSAPTEPQDSSPFDPQDPTTEAAEDTQAAKTSNLPLIIGGSVLGLLLIGGGAYFAMRKRK